MDYISLSKESYAEEDFFLMNVTNKCLLNRHLGIPKPKNKQSLSFSIVRLLSSELISTNGARVHLQSTPNDGNESTLDRSSIEIRIPSPDWLRS
ncbi:hypothetical protein CDAR_435261 [Caerostris darwini]|uniref:Uncharacterized protein n=1 Tax=Caerostris darwini TaxID=1538125 RepID=A0AAV4SIY1_9ARAC|nr:hypothetical protein CDAR_435261 [Caerostris darwini]